MSGTRFVELLVALAVTAELSVGVCQADPNDDRTPLDLFELRIMPIFRSPQPSSCVQCHLTAVDLKDYIVPDHEKTFASLRDQGLIDVNEPDQSKILTLIRMGEKDLDEAVRLIHHDTRNAEYEAFAAWISACCKNPRLRNLPPLSAAEQAKPDRPDVVIRHARKSRIVDSFVRNVWSQRLRCFPCHTPHELDESNPKHRTPIDKQKEIEQHYGPELAERVKIFKATPEATMQYLIRQSRETLPGEIPLIDLEKPARSLLVMKPTSKPPPKDASGKLQVPSAEEPMSHMGGLKMHLNDHSYKSFLSWIEDYARVVGGKYTSVDDLPDDNWYPSKLILKVKQTPEAWPVGVPVQLFVHAWEPQAEGWQREAIAFTQGTVTPRRMVNGALFLLALPNVAHASGWDGETGSLPRGRYLVKAYVDFSSRLADKPTLLLGPEDYFGQTEIKKARWREGFRHAESVSGSSLK